MNWKNVKQIKIKDMLETVRIKVRELIQFLDKNGGKEIVYSNFEDEIGQQQLLKNQSYETASDLAQYRKKVEFYLKEHQEHIAIHKLKFNKPITKLSITQELHKTLKNKKFGNRRKSCK